MQLGLHLTLSPRLEQRPEQELSLRQYLAHDFSGFINLGDDNDVGLLKESAPFLVLHEASHPLYTENKIYIPPLWTTRRLQERLTEQGKHNATEVGIDKAAMLIGKKVCGYSAARMYQSHVAIAERVYRDIFGLEQVEAEPGFLARLEAELRIHQSKAGEPVRQRIETLLDKFSDATKKMQYRHSYGLYLDLMHAYARVYHQTKLIKPPQVKPHA